MSRFLFLFLLAVVFGASVTPARAQSLNGLFKMKIKGGDVYFAFTSAPEGGDPDPVETGGRYLNYFVGAGASVTMKIAVETMCPGQKFSLQVRPGAFSTTLGGTPAGPVDLVDGQPPADFIRDILPVSANTEVELIYRAEVLMSQGGGRDQHTVTYTLIEQ